MFINFNLMGNVTNKKQNKNNNLFSFFDCLKSNNDVGAWTMSYMDVWITAVVDEIHRCHQLSVFTVRLKTQDIK